MKRFLSILAFLTILALPAAASARVAPVSQPGPTVPATGALQRAWGGFLRLFGFQGLLAPLDDIGGHTLPPPSSTTTTTTTSSTGTGA